VRENCASAGRSLDQIARPRHEQPYVHAVVGGRFQRLHVLRDADEVRVREPQRLCRHGGDELVEAVESGDVGHGCEHAHHHVPAGRELLGIADLVHRQRLTGHRPDVGERELDVGDRRPAHFEPGIAPGLDAALEAALPLAAHAKPAHVPDATVHRDHLPVVAREPGERAVEARRIEAAHLAARGKQRAPQLAAVPAETAHPVVERIDAHAAAGRPRERIDELAADGVVRDDVILEKNALARALDGGEPSRIIFRRIPEDAHGVAADERSTRRT
jgi:hypothetical protein